ncbi:CBN-EGL-9 protein [Aphelenchoides avenae]|nr:CBN-EGL-9 protein [Aphelenchus avenae]
MPNLPGCKFCGVRFGNNSQPLTWCNQCNSVAYCGDEHKNFDWKRHKPFCLQIRREAMRTQSMPTSTTSEDDAASNSGTSDAGSKRNERIVETSDPDVQIVESASPKPASVSTSTSRKRALESGKKYKDHSKNVLFKTTLQEHMRSLAATGLALNQHQAIALRLRYIAEHVIRSLNEYGWAVVDNFLGKTHCRHTYNEVESLYNRGLFADGLLVDGRNDFHPKEIRSDQTYWFDGSDSRAKDCVTVRLLVSMIDSVIVHFKDRIPPYKISGRSRAMIAVYPGNGTRYVKHVDNPVRDGRCITTIYYCNEDWNLGEHGGTMRLYPETSEVPMDIDPKADRLVFFWSDRRNPHEVLPVFRPRYAITIWYFDHIEKTEALERKKNADEGMDQTPSGNEPAVNTTLSSTLSNSQMNMFDYTQKPTGLTIKNEPAVRPLAVPTLRRVNPQSAPKAPSDKVSSSVTDSSDDEETIDDVVMSANEGASTNTNYVI